MLRKGATGLGQWCMGISDCVQGEHLHGQGRNKVSYPTLGGHIKQRQNAYGEPRILKSQFMKRFEVSNKQFRTEGIPQAQVQAFAVVFHVST